MGVRVEQWPGQTASQCVEPARVQVLLRCGAVESDRAQGTRHREQEDNEAAQSPLLASSPRETLPTSGGRRERAEEHALCLGERGDGSCLLPADKRGSPGEGGRTIPQGGNDASQERGDVPGKQHPPETWTWPERGALTTVRRGRYCRAAKDTGEGAGEVEKWWRSSGGSRGMECMRTK